MEQSFKLLVAAIVAASLLSVIMMVLWKPLPEFDLTNTEVTSTDVYPDKGSVGTVFSIRAEVASYPEEGVRKCEQPKEVRAVIGGEKAVLIDNGLQGDEKENDCVFGGTWNSELSSGGKKQVFIEVGDYSGKIKRKRVGNVSLTETKCITVSNGKINIVFIGSNYSDPGQIVDDARIHSMYLFNVQPFKDYEDEIKITALNTSMDLDCGKKQGVSEGIHLIQCDDTLISRLGARCGADEIVVLLNSTKMIGSAIPHAYVSRIYPEILVHELGHSFGKEKINLGDQYSYGISSDQGRIEGLPNCDVEGCPKWDQVKGTSCVKVDKFGLPGCTYTDWYSPKKFDAEGGVSVMEGIEAREKRVLSPPFEKVGFDPVSEQYLKKVLEEYK